MAKAKIFKIVALFFTLVASCQVLAGFIRIIPKQDVKVSLEAEQVKIEGYYEVTNDGNEAALRVFPKIEIDKWLYVGEPIDLKPQSSHQWKFSESKSKAEVFTDVNLNPRGVWAAKVERNYSDLNSYPYAVQDLFFVQIGENFTSSERLAMQSPKVQSQFKLENKSYGGSGDWTLENTSTQEINVLLSLLIAKEFKVEGLPQAGLKLAPGEKKKGSLRINNESALPGSNYNVSLLLSYFDPLDQVQVAKSNSAILNITAAQPWSFSWGWLGVGLVAIIAIIGFIKFQPR